ncbi:hypothetical protein P886_0752 [Alteromonadaceae bacterium 2753L.S.0a.02]|nr:hypothetical protein P886_0752 [Alteromonadaceae bacterium 2753L.S.0a.02]
MTNKSDNLGELSENDDVSKGDVQAKEFAIAFFDTELLFWLCFEISMQEHVWLKNDDYTP